MFPSTVIEMFCVLTIMPQERNEAAGEEEEVKVLEKQNERRDATPFWISRAESLSFSPFRDVGSFCLFASSFLPSFLPFLLLG